MQGTDGFRVEGFFEKNGVNEKISCKWAEGKKEIYANDIIYEKPSDHIGKYASVIIAPDDIELINGASEQRRKWVDSILGQTDMLYLENLLTYQKVLLQRNAWLKQQNTAPSIDRAALDFYNEKLVETGNYIHQKRAEFIDLFLPVLQKLYTQLCNGKEQVQIIYETDLSEKKLAAWLESSFQQDIRLQRTSRGLHKDDWDFILNTSVLKNFASQGQKKSFLFALKLAQYEYLRTHHHNNPILLLDDIFEKLDQKRAEALFQMIQHPDFGQVLLTDTHIERVKIAFGDKNSIDFINLQ